ncbi:MAG: phosphotransferase [Phycisphaerales bacterium]|nr:phosphotransferase [Phycisphaerales bacterium]
MSPSDTQALGESLGPLLRNECRGHLGEIHWFRADWQRGGAATGFATWTLGTGQTVDAMVKLPVGHREWFWTTRLGLLDADGWNGAAAVALPTPRLLASGESLGGYDLAWIVIERLLGPPISRKRSRDGLEGLLRATAEFQGGCSAVKPVDEIPPAHDWHTAVRSSREAVHRGDCPDEQQWNDALKKVGRHLDGIVARWNARPASWWCHGDVHPANALRRVDGGGANSSRFVIIDLALVHAGHWIEDGLYLERQHWGHEDYLFGVDPVGSLAAARRSFGLDVEDGFERWADLRRVLTAAAAPGLIGVEGNARYLRGALDVLTRLLKRAPDLLGSG